MSEMQDCSGLSYRNMMVVCANQGLLYLYEAIAISDVDNPYLLNSLRIKRQFKSIDNFIIGLSQNSEDLTMLLLGMKEDDNFLLRFANESWLKRNVVNLHLETEVALKMNVVFDDALLISGIQHLKDFDQVDPWFTISLNDRVIFEFYN